MKYIILLFIMALGMKGQSQTQKVIFVCEHGAAKSVIAAAQFNRIAKERDLNWEATCRGTFPDAAIGESTKAGLISDNLYDPEFSPRKLSVTDTSGVKKIILFTKLPAAFSGTSVSIEDWSTLPNIDGDYVHRRDAIVDKINLFFDSLPTKK
jgi:arsenate reductase